MKELVVAGQEGDAEGRRGEPMKASAGPVPEPRTPPSPEAVAKAAGAPSAPKLRAAGSSSSAASHRTQSTGSTAHAGDDGSSVTTGSWWSLRSSEDDGGNGRVHHNPAAAAAAMSLGLTNPGSDGSLAPNQGLVSNVGSRYSALSHFYPGRRRRQSRGHTNPRQRYRNQHKQQPSQRGVSGSSASSTTPTSPSSPKSEPPTPSSSRGSSDRVTPRTPPASLPNNNFNNKGQSRAPEPRESQLQPQQHSQPQPQHTTTTPPRGPARFGAHGEPEGQSSTTSSICSGSSSRSTGSAGSNLMADFMRRQTANGRSLYDDSPPRHVSVPISRRTLSIVSAMCDPIAEHDAHSNTNTDSSNAAPMPEALTIEHDHNSHDHGLIRAPPSGEQPQSTPSNTTAAGGTVPPPPSTKRRRGRSGTNSPASSSPSSFPLQTQPQHLHAADDERQHASSPLHQNVEAAAASLATRAAAEEPEERGPRQQFRILLLGDSGVGKTSLIRRFADGAWAANMLSTAGVDYKVCDVRVSDQDVRLQLWDTAGQEKFRVITRAYYRGAHGIVLVYDVTDKRTFANVQAWMNAIRNHADSHVHKILVGNKLDLFNPDNPDHVPLAAGEDMAERFGMLFAGTSAKAGTNVHAAFEEMAGTILRHSRQREAVLGTRAGSAPLFGGGGLVAGSRTRLMGTVIANPARVRASSSGIHYHTSSRSRHGLAPPSNSSHGPLARDDHTHTAGDQEQAFVSKAERVAQRPRADSEDDLARFARGLSGEEPEYGGAGDAVDDDEDDDEATFADAFFDYSSACMTSGDHSDEDDAEDGGHDDNGRAAVGVAGRVRAHSHSILQGMRSARERRHGRRQLRQAQRNRCTVS